jgi:hypothetical protein
MVVISLSPIGRTGGDYSFAPAAPSVHYDKKPLLDLPDRQKPVLAVIASAIFLHQDRTVENRGDKFEIKGPYMKVPDAFIFVPFEFRRSVEHT